MANQCVILYLAQTIRKNFQNDHLTIDIRSQPLTPLEVMVFKTTKFSIITTEAEKYYPRKFDLRTLSFDTHEKRVPSVDLFMLVADSFAEKVKEIFREQVEIHKDASRCLVYIECGIRTDGTLIILHPKMQTLFYSNK